MYLLKDRLPGLPGARDEAERSGQDSTALPQAGGRYAAELTRFLQARHLPGSQIRLTDVLIEPRLLRGRLPATTLEEDEAGTLVETDIYRVIPLLHQFPAIYAAFSMETISLLDLETGDRHIALLGQPGTGKSTALAALGLIALRAIDPEIMFRSAFEEARFEEDDDENTPEHVRERRRREREEVQRRAIEQLRFVQHREEEAERIEALDLAVDFQNLLPIYVHLNDLDLNPAAYGGSIDPVEPIIKAQMRYLGDNSALLSAPLLYNALSDGDALVLLDGFDELLASQHAPYLEWLAQLRQHYGQNFLIVAGPATGHDPLLRQGLAPVFIDALGPYQIEQLVEKWTGNWDAFDEPMDEASLQRLRIDNRNRSVLDLTMKLSSSLRGHLRESGMRGYYERWVRAQFANEDDAQQFMPILYDLAAQWLDSGQAPDEATTRQIIRHHLGLATPEASPEAEDADNTKKRKKDSSSSQAEDVQALRKLTETSILVQRPNGGLGFAHPVVAWYLAGESLSKASPERLARLPENDSWHGALRFAATMMDIEPAIVKNVIQAKPDLMFSNIFVVSHWMADAPDDRRWKGEVLKRLGAALMHPNQFPTVREHAVAALVTARDRSGGVIYIFRQAVRSGNPDLRRLGCIGLGAMGTEDAIDDLQSMLFDDVFEVQLAAGLALGLSGQNQPWPRC
ncbi:MAG: HEAT repeat domain-containing protein [Anaerolineales bacterium]